MSRYYRVKTLMLKGEKGDTGYSITNIQMNDDYTLTITIENGMQFHTLPIRGEKGEQGACIRSAELRDDYSLLFTLDNGETLETTAILGKEFENIRTLEASAQSASKIATSASTSASASAESASKASISASESASSASTSASASAQSAKNASKSATNAQESATSASTSADTATSKATEASASATKAKEYEVNAKSSETNASNSAKESEASAVNAKASEDKAKEYADNLKASTDDISKLKEDLVANSKDDAKTKRSLSALWDLNNGISYRFETDSEEAYKKQVQSGAKLGAVNKIGGKTIVMNQLITNVGKISFSVKEKQSEGWLFGKNDIWRSKTLLVKNHKYIGLLQTDCKNITVLNANHGSQSTDIFICEDDQIYSKDYGLYVNSSGVNVGEYYFSYMLFDLTKMFGSGNEPSTPQEFEAMFPNDYYPYNEGELMSMSVNNVVEQGKNYFDFSKLKVENQNACTIDYDNRTITIYSKNSYAKSLTTLRELCPDIITGTYVISMNRSNPKSFGGFYLVGSGKTFTINKPTELTNAEFNSKIIFYNADNADVENVISNIQIEKSSTVTSYSPYKQKTCAIPQSILNLEGYGWSSVTAYNYVDFENKKFVKNVGKYVVTGDEDLYINEAIKDIYIGTNSTNFYIIKNIGQEDIEDPKAISNKLSYLDECWMKDSNYDAVSLNSGKQIHIRILNSKLGITKEATIVEAREAMNKYLKNLYGSGNPIIIYYELAEPIVTDISDIIGDTFQEPFEVESGGSLTFKNVNGDGYQVAVPSDIQYTVSLKEVNS